MKDQKDCVECSAIRPGQPRCRYCLSDLIGEMSEKLARTEAALEEVKTVLEFYRDEDNWTKGIVEACSPIIADTGTKARAFLEKYFGGNNENAM